MASEPVLLYHRADAVLRYIDSNLSFTTSQFASALEFTKPIARKHLSMLAEVGWIKLHSHTAQAERVWTSLVSLTKHEG